LKGLAELVKKIKKLMQKAFQRKNQEANKTTMVVVVVVVWETRRSSIQLVEDAAG
jgi:hypothetical protein